jgi:hypothetical protein
LSVALHLPSVADAPVPFDDALAAILGYARARRPVTVRTPTHPDGVTVRVPKWAYEAYDCQPPSDGAGFSYWDVLVIDGLNGQLRGTDVENLKAAADAAAEHVERAVALAGGRAFWELDEAEVRRHPPKGSVGEAMAAAWSVLIETDSVDIARTHKVLHHKHPRLFPLIDRRTRERLVPLTDDHDIGLWAVIHRELRANGTQFDELERLFADSVRPSGLTPLWRLRLHDILLWLVQAGQFDIARHEGRATAEWNSYVGS